MKTGLEEFNEFIEQLFQYWDGQVTEDDLCRNPFLESARKQMRKCRKTDFIVCVKNTCDFSHRMN